MLLSQITAELSYRCEGFRDEEIQDIVYDSRRASPGTLFVALCGAAADGHDYAEAAYRAGARCFLAERPLSLPGDAQVLYTENTRAALAVISAAFFRHPDRELKLIGVTGTKGKTTVTHMLRACLDASGVPAGVIGTVGAYFGDTYTPTVNTTPESYETMRLLRQMADAGAKAVCMEVSSLGLKHHRVDGILFDEAVFTNLSPDHIGGAEHASFEEYVYWKTQLFSRCRRAVLCADDPFSETLAERLTVPYTTFGLEGSADLTADEIVPVHENNLFGERFLCRRGEESARVTTAQPGLFSVLNALACIAVCLDLGVELQTAAAALKTAVVRGRNECVPVPAPFDVVIDYAHNGQSFHAVLDTFSAYSHNRIITVFGSVGDRAQLRRAEMGAVSGARADLSILTADDPGFEDPAAIAAEIAEAVKQVGGKYEIVPDRTEAVHRALSLAGPGDIVLLLGKGHETAQKVRGKKVPYSDREAVESYFRQKRGETRKKVKKDER